MTSAEILKTTFLDVLFENRNKAYGAYALRKYYNQRLLTALGISIFFVFSFLLLLSNKNKSSTATPDAWMIDDVVVRTQDIPQKPKAPKPPKATPPQKQALPVAQQQHTQIRITNKAVDVTDVPVQDDLTNVVIANKTADGLLSGALPTVEQSEGGTANTAAPDAETTAAPAYTAPQFPGGASAWSAFLSRHLQVPEALEQGEKKTVAVRFFVSKDGTVNAFEIVQSGGTAFNAEVIRVLKKMPKWKPALRNGHPVDVPFTQPVTFIAMDE